MVLNGSVYSLISGPHTWNFASGYQGWREFIFASPIAVEGGRTYIISISTGPDNYYVASTNFSAVSHGDYLSYVKGGYSAVMGSVPTMLNSNCYFRDVVFALSGSDLLIPGTIGVAQTICYNTAPSALTALAAPVGGTGDYTYQWQSSPDNVVWTDISGATLSGYAPAALTENTYYRRGVSSGTLAPVYSEPASDQCIATG